MNSKIHLSFSGFSFFVVVFMLIMSTVSCFGQGRGFMVNGVVFDSISNRPMANINILTDKPNSGSVTNENGFFQIQSESPLSLEFSFVGYQTKRIHLVFNGDTMLNILLTPKTFELNEVSISGDKNTYNATIPRYTVMDYSFMGDSIFVLQKERSINGNTSLVLLNENYDTILFLSELPKGARKIFKDCLNSHHILTADSAYQIGFDSQGILFYQPHEIKLFQQILGNCLFRKNSDIFFENETFGGYGHEIIFINESTKTRKVFVNTLDTSNLTTLNKKISDISSDYYLHNIVNASTNCTTTIEHIHAFDHFNRYIREYENKPVKNTLVLLKDTLVYFNFIESKIQIISNIESSPVEIPIDARQIKKWGPELLNDPVEQRVYSLVKNKAFYEVYLIDIKTATGKFITRISVFDGDDFQINHGYLYFLKSPASTANQVRKLSRVKLI